MTRFGYLVPEFPGQTHAFFWRELRALHDLGYQPEPVSTRRPKQSGTTPDWARTLLPGIHYLTPPEPRALAATSKLSLYGLKHARTLAQAAGLMQPASSREVDPRDLLRSAALFLAGAELAQHAESRGWTHIHVHSCADAAQVALFAHVLSGITYSMTLHGPLSDYGRNQRQKWSHAKFSVVITEKLLAETRQRLGESMPPNVRVAPMGVELSTFSRTSPYSPWDRSGPARIFSCGRLNPSKGHLELLAAFRSILDTGMDAILTIAGEDELGGRGYRAVVEQAIVQLDLTGRVTLLGAVPESRIRDELERTHVFALASHQEPLGVAIMEAMAMEVPVVATSAGGVPDLVLHGHSGTLVEPGDTDGLAKAVLTTLSNPALALGMGQRARERLAATYDVRTSARALAALI
ncbi:exopolysaccharide biosynthesis GT4 family glycosyltransferase EpsE [Paenarthrobacter sp. S56]|uniref:exopolysaccharide biosynthesis GT4 family glycosyltransferase EpsE n=1 Tax=Paenarthrobacter sp. S56 TaxID=3138179 RepID=UPI00321964FF